MVDKLARTRFLAVVGTSGCGKSSLVNCGLVPALHRGLMASAGSAWHVVMMRPGNQPLNALAEALAQPGALGSWKLDEDVGFSAAEMIEASLRMGRLGLVDVIEQAHLPPRHNLLLVVDQFEELFRYQSLGQPSGASPARAGSSSADAIAFVNLLLEAAAQRELPVHVVLSMRSDFLGDCAAFQGLPEAINRGQYLVPRMTRDERRSAIAGPVGVGGAEIDPVLLTRLVNDVGEDPDQLSILQHALNRTWSQWQQEGGKGPLTLRHYEAVGTMSHALSQHAEEAFAELPSGRQHALAEAMFKAITDQVTDARGTRRPTRLDTLCEITGATPAELGAVIDVFRRPSRSFLMPPEETVLEADTPIDISHESLMRVWGRLRGWAEEEARSAQTYRRLAETAELHASGRAGLLRPPDLHFATEWRKRQHPVAAWARRYRDGFEATMRFLDESENDFKQDQLKARARSSRVRIASGAAILVLMATSLLLALVSLQAEQASRQARDAEQQARDAESRAKLSEVDASKARAELESALNVLRQQPAWGSLYESAVQTAPNVQSTVQQAVKSRSLTYLHFGSPGQKALAERLRATLERAGYSAPGIEQVAQTPSRPEVRYFREADAGDAAALSELMTRWGWGTVKSNYLKGYEAKGPRHLEVWLPRPDPADIQRLLRQINAATPEERRAATAQLVERYSGSSLAITETLALLAPERIDALSPGGLVNALYFLARTAPLAWDPPMEAQGREVVERVRARHGAAAQAQAEIERLARLLDTVRAGEPMPVTGR